MQNQRTTNRSRMLKDVSEDVQFLIPNSTKSDSGRTEKIYSCLKDLYYSMTARLITEEIIVLGSSVLTGIGAYRSFQQPKDPLADLAAIGAGLGLFIMGSLIAGINHSERYDDYNTNAQSRWH